MTTINNIEDLARILETHPHWASTLRALVLSDEVLNLPQAMAALTANVSRLSESVRHLEAGQEQLRTDVTELKVGQEQLRADVTELRTDVTGLKAGQEELAVRQTRLERSVERLRDDIAPIKGRFAQNLAVEQSVVIALRMRLAYRSRVTQREMADLLGGNDTSDLAANEIESLVLADLIFTAADSNDELWYVALEASYTADERDTRRAIRNAALLTRFTGIRVRPVIAAALIDDRIRGDVASGSVFWYALDETEFRATD